MVKNKQLPIDDNNFVTTHPTVRTYFKESNTDEDLLPLHIEISKYYQDNLSNEKPKTLNDAFQYFDLCYHLAKSKLWSLFDYYYNTIINQGDLHYLGYSTNAWEENIYLAKMIFPNQKFGENSYYKAYILFILCCKIF